MVATRSSTGATPRKPSLPAGYVETPGTRQRSSRKSTPNGFTPDSIPEKSTSNGKTSRAAEPDDAINVLSKRPVTEKTASKVAKRNESKDHRIDDSGEFEFGGDFGVTCMMIGFPLLMWYMWIGATYYNGKFPTPAKGESFVSFIKHLGHLVYTGAYPSLKAWTIYWVFFVFQGILYMVMPGVYTEGKPLPHLGGEKLTYYCSGVWSFYTSIAIAAVLHVTGIFPLYTLIDEFGPLMTVAIISGFIISIIAYYSAIYRGQEHRMSGHFLYDFFMGAELNPRMFGLLDFKMFFEVRMPWYILFFLTLGAAARQYEQLGYVSGEVLFMLMAHWLYANACCKGEELIPPTWDMYYEKWGFMLIFWNLAGVPLTYCHGTIYLANHHPSVYHWPAWILIPLTASYLFAYYVWDTAASQKNMFRASQRGQAPQRKSFPQLPWKAIENPRTIPVEGGDPLFADGWYRYARKIHYTSDMWFSICWGLITGFGSPFPWFYPVFFAIMITHRAQRDIQKCRERYGKSWEEYERQCPWLFIPVSRLTS